jgi:hypothetical protein
LSIELQDILISGDVFKILTQVNFGRSFLYNKDISIKLVVQSEYLRYCWNLTYIKFLFKALFVTFNSHQLSYFSMNKTLSLYIDQHMRDTTSDNYGRAVFTPLTVALVTDVTDDHRHCQNWWWAESYGSPVQRESFAWSLANDAPKTFWRS